MEKKKGFQMPHTYIIIFGVILFAALLTVFIPLGKYDTKEITYMQNGVEKTRTVLDPESFQYILDENGNKVTKAAPIFGTEDFGGQGILNYVFEGGSYNRNGLYRKKCMVRIRKREENGTTDINIYTSYNDNAVWNLPVGIFSGSEAG